MKTKKVKPLSAEELDELFDNGGDITPYLDLKSTKVFNGQPKRVNVDFPVWMVRSLDKQAAHLGVTRQSLIKMWIAQNLKSL